MKNMKKNKQKLQINWKDININTTLFCDLWWLDLDNFLELSDEDRLQAVLKACNTLQEKINSKINLIHSAIADLELIREREANLEEKHTIDIFINSLLEKLICLIIV